MLGSETLFHFSVMPKHEGYPDKKIYALVYAASCNEALARLKRDDPLWEKSTVVIEKISEELRADFKSGRLSIRDGLEIWSSEAGK